MSFSKRRFAKFGLSRINRSILLLIFEGRSGTNIVLLDRDVADAFPTAESVNEALRMLLTIAQRQKQTVPVE
jgi:hypothetical protein